MRLDSTHLKDLSSQNLFWRNWQSTCCQKTSPRNDRSSPPEVFQEKDVLKICGKLTRENSCWGVISIKLLCNFIEITLWHGCPSVNLLSIFSVLFFSSEQLWKAASKMKISKIKKMMIFFMRYIMVSGRRKVIYV